MPPYSKLYRIEPAQVQRALETADGVISTAAKSLGVQASTLRAALRSYLRDLAPLVVQVPRGRPPIAIDCETARLAVVEAGSAAQAAKALGIAVSTLRDRL